MATRARLKQFAQRKGTTNQDQANEDDTMHMNKDISKINVNNSHMHLNNVGRSEERIAENNHEPEPSKLQADTQENIDINIQSKQLDIVEKTKKHSYCEKEVSRYDSQLFEVFDNIETSIRTAGLKKGRENGLIEEIQILKNMIQNLSNASRNAGICSEDLRKHKLEIENDKKYLINMKSRIEMTIQDVKLQAENETMTKLKVFYYIIKIENI